MAANATRHQDLITAFEKRWDYASARVMLAEVLTTAGVDKQAAYDAEAVKAICTAIADVPGDSQAVITKLTSAEATAAPAAKAAAPAAKAAAPAEKAAAPAEKAAAPAEKAADAKKAPAPKPSGKKG